LKKFNRKYIHYFSFKRKTKKVEFFFTILHIPCKFQQNRLKKVAVGLNGLRKKSYTPLWSWEVLGNSALVSSTISEGVTGLEVKLNRGHESSSSFAEVKMSFAKSGQESRLTGYTSATILLGIKVKNLLNSIAISRGSSTHLPLCSIFDKVDDLKVFFLMADFSNCQDF
jgi:hypothetical protein